MPHKDPIKQKQAQKRWSDRRRKALNEKTAARKRELQAWFQEYKAQLKCEKCSEDHPVCLEFHHKDRSSKDMTVCFMASKGYSKDRILAEISKCEVLCSNCHRKWHYENDNAYGTRGST